MFSLIFLDCDTAHNYGVRVGIKSKKTLQVELRPWWLRMSFDLFYSAISAVVLQDVGGVSWYGLCPAYTSPPFSGQPATSSFKNAFGPSTKINPDSGT
tara:strand:+ start:214 stop:507 length:294 start_codon:yes stop_codon:yes gene_type:complete